MPFIRFSSTGGGGTELSGIQTLNSADGPNITLSVGSGLYIVNDPTNDVITIYINPNSGNIFEHGTLRELLDDDHPQYWLGNASRAVSGTYLPDQSGLRDIGQRTLPVRGIHSNSGVFANDTIRLLNELIRFQGSGNIYSIDDLILNSLADFSAFGNTSATIDTYGRAQIQANEQVTLAADIDNANSGVITYDMTSGVWVRKNQTTGFQKIAVIDDITAGGGITSINSLSAVSQFISGASGITVTSSGTNTHFIKAESGFLATIFITSGTLGASGQHLGLRIDSLETSSGYLNNQVNNLISASGNLDIRVTALQDQSGWTIEGVTANGGNINLIEGSGIARIDSNNVSKTITIHTSGFVLDSILNASGQHIGLRLDSLESSSGYLNTQVNALIASSGNLNTRTNSLEAQSGWSIESVKPNGGNIDLVPGVGIASIIGDNSTKTITINTSGFSTSGIQEINNLNNASIIVTGISGVITDTSGTRFVRVYSDTNYLDTIFATDLLLNSSGNTISSRILKLEGVSGTIEGVSFDAGNIDLVPGSGIASIVGDNTNKTITIHTSGFTLNDISGIQNLNGLTTSNITILGLSGVTIDTSGSSTIRVFAETGYLDTIFATDSALNSSGNSLTSRIIRLEGVSGTIEGVPYDGGNIDLVAGLGIASIVGNVAGHTITISTSGYALSVDLISSGQTLSNRIVSLENASGYLNTHVNSLISASGDLDTRTAALQSQSGWSIEGVAPYGLNIDLVPGIGIASIVGSQTNKTITISTSGFSTSGIQEINTLNNASIVITGISGVIVDISGTRFIRTYADTGYLDTIFATDTSLNTSGNALISRILNLEGVSGTLEGVGFDAGNIDLVPGFGITSIVGSIAGHTITISTSGFLLSAITSINSQPGPTITIGGVSGILVLPSGSNYITIAQASGSIQGIPIHSGGNTNILAGSGISRIDADFTNRTITIHTSGSTGGGITSINSQAGPAITIDGSSGIFVNSAGNTITISQQSGSIEGVSNYLGGNIDLVPPSGWGITGNDTNKTITFVDSGIMRINGILGPHVELSGTSGIFLSSDGNAIFVAQQSGGFNQIPTHIGGNISLLQSSGTTITTDIPNRNITITTSGLRSINTLTDSNIIITGASGIFAVSAGNTVTIAQQSGSIEGVSNYLGGNIDLVASSGLTITGNDSAKTITITTSGIRSINTLTDTNPIVSGASGLFVSAAGNLITIAQQSGSIEGVSNYLGGNIDLIASSGLTITGNDSNKTITITTSGIRSVNTLTNTNIVVAGTSGIFVTSAGNTVTVSQQSGSIEGVSNYNGGNINLVPGLGVASIVGNDSAKTITIATSGYMTVSSGLKYLPLDIGGGFETAGVSRYTFPATHPYLNWGNTDETVGITWSVKVPENWCSGTPMYFDAAIWAEAGLIFSMGLQAQPLKLGINPLIPTPIKMSGFFNSNGKTYTLYSTQSLFKIPADLVASGEYLGLFLHQYFVPSGGGTASINLSQASLIYSGIDTKYGKIENRNVLGSI